MQVKKESMSCMATLLGCVLEQRPPPLRDEIYIGITFNGLNVTFFAKNTRKGMTQVQTLMQSWCSVVKCIQHKNTGLTGCRGWQRSKARKQSKTANGSKGQRPSRKTGQGPGNRRKKKKKSAKTWNTGHLKMLKQRHVTKRNWQRKRRTHRVAK